MTRQPPERAFTPPPSLRGLQHAFAAAVYEDDATILTHVTDGVFPAARELQIYRRNTFVSLTDALAADYPVVRRLVGDGFFDYAADRYIRRHPPRRANLHEFGDRFAGFLAEFPAAQATPYLPDVARLEWARVEAYHAAGAPALALDVLAQVSPKQYDALIFLLQPAARVLTSRYPILRIWNANQQDAPDQTVDLDRGGEHVLVGRVGLQVAMTALSAGEYALLHAIAAATPLAAANAAAVSAEPAFDLMQSLQRHVRSAAISGFRLA